MKEKRYIRGYIGNYFDDVWLLKEIYRGVQRGGELSEARVRKVKEELKIYKAEYIREYEWGEEEEESYQKIKVAMKYIESKKVIERIKGKFIEIWLKQYGSEEEKIKSIVQLQLYCKYVFFGDYELMERVYGCIVSESLIDRGVEEDRKLLKSSSLSETVLKLMEGVRLEELLKVIPLSKGRGRGIVVNVKCYECLKRELGVEIILGGDITKKVLLKVGVESNLLRGLISNAFFIQVEYGEKSIEDLLREYFKGVERGLRLVKM